MAGDYTRQPRGAGLTEISLYTLGRLYLDLRTVHHNNTSGLANLHVTEPKFSYVFCIGESKGQSDLYFRHKNAVLNGPTQTAGEISHILTLRVGL